MLKYLHVYFTWSYRVEEVPWKWSSYISYTHCSSCNTSLAKAENNAVFVIQIQFILISNIRWMIFLSLRVSLIFQILFLKHTLTLTWNGFDISEIFILYSGKAFGSAKLSLEDTCTHTRVHKDLINHSVTAVFSSLSSLYLQSISPTLHLLLAISHYYNTGKKAPPSPC